jgi:hypothetical protein
MKTTDFNKVMGYLDVIEVELNKIAKAFGHVSFNQFFDDWPNVIDNHGHGDGISNVGFWS